MHPTVAQAFWVGIDVAAEKFDAACTPTPCDPKTWMKLKCRTFPLSPAGVKSFIAWVQQQPGTCEGLCAESTGIYSEQLRTLLEEHSDLPRLSIENPERIKGTARMLAAPGKTDEIDARVIAFYAASNRPAPKEPISPGQKRLREAKKLRDSLQKHLLALTNQLESQTDAAAQNILKKVLRTLERQLAEAEQLIEDVISEDDQLSTDCKLLTSVPGIGEVVAAEILALFGDLRKWKRREIISRAGLVPLPHESGKSVRGRARLSRRGGALLRKKLYMPMTRVVNSDYSYNARVRKRFEANEPGKVCICAGMRKALVVARAVVISGKKFDKELAARCTPAKPGDKVAGRAGG